MKCRFPLPECWFPSKRNRGFYSSGTTVSNFRNCGVKSPGILKEKPINCFLELISGFFVVYLAVLLTITLWPAPVSWGRVINIVPFRDVYYTAKSQGFTGAAMYTVKISFYNILLFIPFGFLGVLLRYFKQRKKYTAVFGHGVVLILSIEALQYILNTGRAADIDDVILNTLGLGIGILFGKWLVGRY